MAETTFNQGMEPVKMKGDKKKKYNKGGKLIGPSHERGGIPIKVKGGGSIEAEGGEYIVNKESMKKHGALVRAINHDSEAQARLKPLRKGGTTNVAKNPKTGKKKKKFEPTYRKGGPTRRNTKYSKKYPGMCK